MSDHYSANGTGALQAEQPPVAAPVNQPKVDQSGDKPFKHPPTPVLPQGADSGLDTASANTAVKMKPTNPIPITVLKACCGTPITKTFNISKQTEDFPKVRYFTQREHLIHNLKELNDFLKRQNESDAHQAEAVALGKARPDWKGQKLPRNGETLQSVPTRLLVLDMDNCVSVLSWGDYDQWDISATVRCELEHIGLTALLSYTCIAMVTASSGVSWKVGHKAKLRLYFLLDDAVALDVIKAWAKTYPKGALDLSLFNPAQMVTTARPIFIEDGKSQPDPIEHRVYYIQGEQDYVPTTLLLDAVSAATPINRVNGAGMPSKASLAKHPRGEDPRVTGLRKAGLYRKEDPNQPGKHFIHCPWAEEHSTPSNESETAYFEHGLNGYNFAAFKCLHASHEDCTLDDLDHVLDAEGYGLTHIYEDDVNAAIEQHIQGKGDSVLFTEPVLYALAFLFYEASEIYTALREQINPRLKSDRISDLNQCVNEWKKTRSGTAKATHLPRLRCINQPTHRNSSNSTRLTNTGCLKKHLFPMSHRSGSVHLYILSRMSKTNTARIKG